MVCINPLSAGEEYRPEFDNHPEDYLFKMLLANQTIEYSIGLPSMIQNAPSPKLRAGVTKNESTKSLKSETSV